MAAVLGRASIDTEPQRWLAASVPHGSVLALDVAGSTTPVSEIDRLARIWPGPVVVASHHPLGSSSERVIRLAPLGRTASQELLLTQIEAYRGRSIVESELTDVAVIAAATDGLPLVLDLVARRFASETTREVRRSLPATEIGLATVIDALVDRLSEEERELLAWLVWREGAFDVDDAHHQLPRPRPLRDSVTNSLRALVA